MASGVALSKDLREVILYMLTHHGLDVKQVAHLTGVSQRTVYRIQFTWRLTGEAKPAPLRKQGRPRALDLADAQVSHYSC